MMRLKTIIIIIIIYLFFVLSNNLNINLFYPYYYIKDLLFYPVKASEKELKLSNDLLDGINTSLLDEINNLKELTNIKTILSEFNYVNATIIMRNREYWFNTITIDKGKKDGITIDSAVVDTNGLIGRVSVVRNNTSDIKLITEGDIKNKISVFIKDNDKEIYGITNDYNAFDNYLEIVILSNSEIKKDSFVYTTGLGGIFPRGILIGKVYEIKKDIDDVTTIVKVKLSSNLEGDKYVSVLQRKEVSDN